jgi:hypothetical protein
VPVEGHNVNHLRKVSCLITSGIKDVLGKVSALCGHKQAVLFRRTSCYTVKLMWIGGVCNKQCKVHSRTGHEGPEGE